MLTVTNLKKVYEGPGGDVVPLDGLNLSVARGESVAIVGPSGCGKTTLLNILGALDAPTTGTVEINGKDMTQLSKEEREQFRNRSLGFIFQQHFLLPQCTALENVVMPRLAGGWEESVEETRSRAESLLSGLGLKDRLEHMPYQLSGGERLRVAVARALINKPLLVLADEPTGSLDPVLSEKVADLFAELNTEQEVTLVMVTHNEAMAKRMKTTYTLLNGKLAKV